MAKQRDSINNTTEITSELASLSISKPLNLTRYFTSFLGIKNKKKNNVTTEALWFIDSLPETQNPTNNTATIVVPSYDILLSQATLPKMSQRRLLQALPFALEEQLIDNIDQLHFAMGPKQPCGRIPVAIVAKEKINSWLEKAKNVGVSPNQLLPDIFTLPATAKNWTIDIKNNLCIARTGDFSGFSCQQDSLVYFLEGSIASAKPESIHLRFFSNDTSITLPEWENITIEKTSHNPNNQLKMVKSAIKTHPSINLLQNNLKTSHPRETKILQTAAAIGAIACIILFTTELTTWIALNKKSIKIKYDIQKIYTKHFPDATAVVAPKIRMQEKLRKSAAADNNHRFLSLLSKIAPAISNTRGIKLEWIDYNNSQLKLGINTSSFNQLNNLIQALKTTGLNIKQQLANTTDSGITASILIRSNS